MIEGFDVSHFQPVLTADFVKHLIADGYSFGGIKASEGTYLTDPNFAANRAACRANGLPRFVYHEATTQDIAGQLDRIMSATGGYLLPRERLVLVLGDFAVPPPVALSLAALVKDQGPVKRSTKARPVPVLYANRSNFTGVYNAPAFRPYPKWVAAFPGDGSECSVPGAVCHQDSDHDPATHGDHDTWCSDDHAAMLAFFRS